MRWRSQRPGYNGCEEAVMVIDVRESKSELRLEALVVSASWPAAASQ